MCIFGFLAYFDYCTLSGWTKNAPLIHPPTIIPIATISTDECYQAWNDYAGRGNKICTRNDYNHSCPVRSFKLPTKIL